MYADEGSWEPSAPLIGGPPGIPGSPLPAEPNVPDLVELGMIPAACTVDGEDGLAEEDPPVPPEGSRLLRRLDDDGF